MHLCITPPNYQPIKAECLLLSHYMEIRSRSESVSREGGREGGKRKRQNGRDGWREEKRGEAQQMYHDAREIRMQTRRSFTKPLAHK